MVACCGEVGSKGRRRGQIFGGLVHPLKVVEIKNPFGIFQPTTQIPREWVGFIFFLKNVFWWDTLGTSQEKCPVGLV